MYLRLKILTPIMVALMLALLPTPENLASHAWYFFAIFAGVIVGLMLEPLHGGAIGMIGVTLVSLLAPWVLFAPQELQSPAFKPVNAGINRAVSGLSNTTAWLIFSAFMFALSYEKTGLGRRIELLQVRKTSSISISWMDWFEAFAPAGIVLLILIPLITYWIYPPEIRNGDEVPKWAARELSKMGQLSGNELILAVLVALALGLWIFAGSYINATTTGLLVISLMLLSGVFSWDDMMKHASAWNTLAWFATLVALAEGLNRVGFVKWFADQVVVHMQGFAPFTAMVLLVMIFYVTHYLFASVTAHVTALLPVMLAVGANIPGVDMQLFALMLCLTLGIMGILTPYATGPSPVYFGSGYLPSKDYWRLGAIFGILFIIVLLVVGLPRLALIR